MEDTKAQRIVPVIDSYISTESLPAQSGMRASSSSTNEKMSHLPASDEHRSARHYDVRHGTVSRSRAATAPEDPVCESSRRSRSRSPDASLLRAPVRNRSPITFHTGSAWAFLTSASGGYYGGSDWATRPQRSRETQFGDDMQLISRGMTEHGST